MKTPLRIFAALALSLLPAVATAQTGQGEIAPLSEDAVLHRAGLPAAPPDTATADAAGRRSLLSRLLSSITGGNVDRTHERAIDLSFVMYPSYSHEPGFGLGGALTGLYRANRRDSVMPPSDCFLSFNASLRGFFQVYIKGNHLFPGRRWRLNYVAEFYRMPLNFWGITAEDAQHNAKSRYDRYQADLQFNLTREILPNLYLGLRMRNNYTTVVSIDNPEYLHGEPTGYFVNGLGLVAEYDTRDNLLSPTRGIRLQYRPAFYWKALGDAPASFWNHTVIFNAYTPLWRDAVLGFDTYAAFNSRNVPWTVREMIASDGIRMRGYYLGSYIDNCQACVQAEYRQRVYKRLGFTLWGGAASLFPSFTELLENKHKPLVLPNWGIGLRFEIKHNANIRLDCGFGRDDSGIIFAFGEAF